MFIQHGEQYVTKYLHLHKRKVKKGQRVTQSQVIGTVGSTGAATGPHLHYEFLMNGVHRNPRTIHKKLPKAKVLPEAEMAALPAGDQQGPHATGLPALRQPAGDEQSASRQQRPTELGTSDALFVGLMSGTSVDAIDAHSCVRSRYGGTTRHPSA